MLMRSSSTPVLGSLLSSISDSPNHHHHHHHPPAASNKHPPTTIPHSLNKVSLHQPAGSYNFTFSCNSSPICPSVSEFSVGTNRSSGNGFRRAQSEGNLEGLVENSTTNVDEFSLISSPIKKFSGKSNGAALETIPSFSSLNSNSRYEDEDSEDEEEAEEREEIVKNGNFYRNSEIGYVNVYGNVEVGEIQQMFLARGLGVGITGLDLIFGSGGGPCGSDGGGFGGGCGGDDGDENGHENGDEEHFKKMVRENPGNPLFLRNYAQFLYQTKQDLEGAEEYYSRAILIDPKDGEILSQYAKLIWELNHDKDRANYYFERAVQASSEDSHVHAAYASFLWEIEDDEDDTLNEPRVLQPLLHRGGAMASATA